MHVKLLVITKPATFNSFCIRLKNPFLLLCAPLVDPPPPSTDGQTGRQSGRGGRGRNNKDRQKFPQPATRSRFVIVPGSCVLSRLSTPPLVSPPASAGQHQRTTPFSKSYSPQESPLTTWTECVVPRGRRRRNPLERGNGGQEEKNWWLNWKASDMTINGRDAQVSLALWFPKEREKGNLIKWGTSSNGPWR